MRTPGLWRTSSESKFKKLNGKVVINYVGTTIGQPHGPGTVALFFWGRDRKLPLLPLN